MEQPTYTAADTTDTATTNIVTTGTSEVYSLKYPYTLPTGDELKQVSLHRLKVADMKMAKRQFKHAEDWDEALIARMTDLNPEDLADMDLEDYQVLSRRFRQFAGLDSE
ncbi:phage tail assembly protein [Morganella morganii]|uniref:Phage tail assembly protein n=1 Tax=Morganella morganii TaxID=582 RepID=A0A8I0U514_MORMO|nr:phage tail assembly protein [Morganella morganii]MBE8611529.1 phage tail assembly protein [Morganella morganii]